MEANIETPNPQILGEPEISDLLTQNNLSEHFSAHDIHRLSHGRYTSLITNVPFEGKLYDGKFVLSETESGKFNLHFIKKKHQIELPDKILEKKLSENDKKALISGEMLGPFQKDGHEIFFHFDKELNEITLHSPKSLGVCDSVYDKMYEYKFTPEEKKQLAEGRNIGPRVYCINGKYFVGSFGISDMGDSYIMKTQIDKEITAKQAKDLILKYNHGSSIGSNKPGDKINKDLSPFFVPKREILPPVANGDHKMIIGHQKDLYLNNPSYFPQGPNRSYDKMIGDKRIEFNQTFAIITMTFDKNKGIPESIFKNHLSKEEITDLKNGKSINDKEFTLKNGQFKGNVHLIDLGNRYQLVIQVNPFQKGHIMDIQKFSAEDKIIMDAVDKMDFKTLNRIIDNGYKPSEDIKRLIFGNDHIPAIIKKEIGQIMKVDAKVIDDLHFKGQEVNKGNNNKKGASLFKSSSTAKEDAKIPTPKGIKKDNKPHIFNAGKNLFHDM